MLEIKNISKTYRPKKGVPVKALDDVSLSFASRGLVFILGKSGSGKSTLLNVIGGLDRADSGEFIIKGKSSKDFSQSDFDAYRNTFIGFIFQEYNILNEFNVGQNIALAMELQGKKATKEALREILDEVDLPGYETRKPNELSGGQKQRIAIARALIKDPEIIMADEPTGALDSNTGKQVFDTLKKLSKTKLVIVVSHDREFAEYYGDRVIELADGKIISDISKYEAAPDSKSSQVSIIDNKIIHIKKGSEMTEKDFEIVRDYLKKINGDILISSDNRSNASFKQMAMISDDGNKASFKETTSEDTPKGSYTPQDSKFIRSRLPYRNALKIGASSLKTKPIRLFFTILLSFVSFAMFGLADTFGSYDKVTAAARSINDLDIPYAAFSLTKNTLRGEGNDTWMSREGVYGDYAIQEEIEEKTGIKVFPVYSGMSNTGSYMSLPQYISSSNSNYYYTIIAGLTEIGMDELNAMNYTLVDGRMPQSDNEIAITNYQYETYKAYGFGSIKEENEEPSVPANEVTPSKIIGKHIKFYINTDGTYEETIDDDEFEIVGIVDTKVDKKYDDLKVGSSNTGFIDYVMMNEFREMITKGIHGMMFVNPGYIDKLVERNLDTRNGTPYECSLAVRTLDGTATQSNYTIESISKLSSFTDTKDIFWVDEEKTTLAANDVIVPMMAFNSVMEILSSAPTYFPAATFITSALSPDSSTFNTITLTPPDWSGNHSYNPEYLYSFVTDAMMKYVIANDVPQDFIDQKTRDGFVYGSVNEWKIAYANELRSWEASWGSDVYQEAHRIGAQIQVRAIAKFASDNNYLSMDDVLKIKTIDYGNGLGTDWDGTLANVVGFKFDNGWFSYGDSNMIVSDDFYATAIEGNQTYFSEYVGVMPNRQGDIKNIVKLNYIGEETEGIQFVLQNQVMSSISDVNSVIEMTSQIFLYVGLGLAAFSALLLANFIAVSISNKKREIGILRAVGAKARDVFTIFFNESVIIALINFGLALVGAIAACILFNNTFSNQLGVSITILSFGIRQIALMLAVSIGVALLASFIPVMAIARKQPIDSIQDR